MQNWWSNYSISFQIIHYELFFRKLFGLKLFGSPYYLLKIVSGPAKLGIVPDPTVFGYQYIGPNTLLDICGEIA
jgi:hypothetical protein